MPKFSANISTLFKELDLLDRPAAAREAGFRAIEIQFPYATAAADMARAVAEAGVEIVLFNVPPGDMAAGDRGLGALPGREAELRAAVNEARAYARELRPHRVNLLAGVPGPDATEAQCLATLAANLRFAAEAFAADGIQVVTEAVNRRDVPGFFLANSAAAIAAIDAADHSNLAIQHDLYHMQIVEGDLIPTLERIYPRIGHIQMADTPGRNEPGTGEINFTTIFAALDRIGYDGWVGAEYTPATTTADSLDWFAPWREPA